MLSLANQHHVATDHRLAVRREPDVSRVRLLEPSVFGRTSSEVDQSKTVGDARRVKP